MPALVNSSALKLCSEPNLNRISISSLDKGCCLWRRLTLKTKRETYTLIELIYLYYEQFQINQQKIDSWHEALKDFSYERLHRNLLKYVTHSSFPPKICDLISTSDGRSRAIPDATETYTQLMNEQPPANEEVVKAELAKIRKLLGIQREE